jgi:hypothetical protein
VKSLGLTEKLRWKLKFLSYGEEVGIPGVAVECVDIRKNTESEGKLLAIN